MIQWDRCRIEIDYRPETVSPGNLRPKVRLEFEFANNDDPLLQAILARWRAQYDAQLAANGGVQNIDFS